MDVEAITKEIVTVRQRLREIETLRNQLPTDSFADRAELQDEEHTLTARMAELQSMIESPASNKKRRGKADVQFVHPG